MTFAVRNLSILAYANGFTLWHYKAENDDQERVSSPGFFVQGGDMLSVGDMVMVTASDGGRLVCMLPDHDCMRATPLG